MAKTLDFDEINALVKYQFEADKSEIIDLAESLTILSYRQGVDDVEDMLDIDMAFDDGIPLQSLDNAVNRKIDGKTMNERLAEYINENGTLEEVQRVVLNECHRVYNNGAFDAAKNIEKNTGLIINKTWRTKNDGKVRDTHDYLEGMTVRLGERFYTWNGDSSEYPGQFGIPSEDVNCRCVVEYSVE